MNTDQNTHRADRERVSSGEVKRVYWVGATSGQLLHSVERCSITRRTRYWHFRMELTAAEAAEYRWCSRCMGGRV